MTRRHALAAALCLAWILPGLFGHDPWKPDEAYTFGLVYDLLKTGDWVVPHLAGEPYLVEPPLFHITAALTARLFSPPLALHDAARVATGLYMGLTFLFCGLAGRELFGRGHGTLAMLLLLGALGLVIRSHQLISDVATLAGFAAAYYGCALARRSAWGGWWMGIGLGVIFLSQGVVETGIAAVIMALLPLLHREWRRAEYGWSLLIALPVAAPWLFIWPSLLHEASPRLFHAWLTQETTARIVGGGREPFFYLTIVPWYGWPLWALGLWALWRAKTQPSLRPAVLLPVVGFVVTLLVLSVTAEKRELHALPLLVPLALLATVAATALRRGATNAWYWFSVMGFTFFIAVAWFYWCALELGVPARLHVHLHHLQPGYTAAFRWFPFVVGACYTIAWFVVLARLPKSSERPAIVWASGITVVWALVAVLFVGWLDVGKSYRSMVRSLQHALPREYRCIASRGLGEPQRAMLDYFAHIITRRVEVTRAGNCDLMLIEGRPHAERPPRGSWVKIWEGARPGDTGERYWLYRKSAGS
jgi:4-amino-4-deoxy-L-arabinose transferase-like glycosyltransferase